MKRLKGVVDRPLNRGHHQVIAETPEMQQAELRAEIMEPGGPVHSEPSSTDSTPSSIITSEDSSSHKPSVS